MRKPSSFPGADLGSNTLVSRPRTLKGHLFGLLVDIQVPAAVWAVVYGLAGRPQVLGPGTYWLVGEPGRGVTVQWVDGRRRRHPLQGVEAHTADGWRLRLDVTLLYQVADPLRVVTLADPRAVLDAVGRSLILEQIGALHHHDLIALLTHPAEPRPSTEEDEDSARAPVFRRLEQRLLAAARRRRALEGLRVLDVAITRCEGDERLTEALRTQALERIREVEAYQTALETEPLRRAHLLQQAETEAAQQRAILDGAQAQLHLANLEAQLRKIQAQTEAELAEMRLAHEREMRILEYQHAETLALIRGTARIAAEAARNGLALPLGGGPLQGDGLTPLDALQSGLDMLDALHEKRMPSLPVPTLGPTRLAEEERRLKDMGAASYELHVRDGRIRGARLHFDGRGNGAEGFSLTFVCPEGYPQEAPTLHLHRNGQAEALPVEAFWQPGRYLAEVAALALGHLRRRASQEEGGHEAA